MSLREGCSVVEITPVQDGYYKLYLPAKVLKDLSTPEHLYWSNYAGRASKHYSNRSLSLLRTASVSEEAVAKQGVRNYVHSRSSANTGVSVVQCCIPSHPLLSLCS